MLLAHGVAVVEGLPGLPLDGVGRVAVVVRVVFAVRRLVVPLGDAAGGEARVDVLHEDVAVAEEDIVLWVVSERILRGWRGLAYP